MNPFAWPLPLNLVAWGVMAFQADATRRVWSHATAARREKVLQTMLIWALPIFGAVLCLLALRHDALPPAPRSKHDPSRGAGCGGDGD